MVSSWRLAASICADDDRVGRRPSRLGQPGDLVRIGAGLGGGGDRQPHGVEVGGEPLGDGGGDLGAELGVDVADDVISAGSADAAASEKPSGTTNSASTSPLGHRCTRLVLGQIEVDGEADLSSDALDTSTKADAAVRRRGRPRVGAEKSSAAPPSTKLSRNATRERGDDPEDERRPVADPEPEVLAGDVSAARTAWPYSRNALPVRCRNTASRLGSLTSTAVTWVPAAVDRRRAAAGRTALASVATTSATGRVADADSTPSRSRAAAAAAASSSPEAVNEMRVALADQGDQLPPRALGPDLAARR